MSKVEKLLMLSSLLYVLEEEFGTNDALTEDEIDLFGKRFFEEYPMETSEDANGLVYMTKDLVRKLFKEEVLEDE